MSETVIHEDETWRYTRGDCSLLAAAIAHLNPTWEPVNLGGNHLVMKEPDSDYAWDITGRTHIDVLAVQWGWPEPMEAWVTFPPSTVDPVHLDVAKRLLADSREDA